MNRLNENILPLYHVDEILYPFIEGSFVCKTGKRLNGFFLIDSGSSENIFNYAAKHTLAEEDFLPESKSIKAIDNQGEDCPTTNIKIAVGDIESDEPFCISKNINFEKYFGKNQIIGILSVNFLCKHHLILDYANKCLRSALDANFSLAHKSFVFPMGFGLQTYGIPVIGIVKENKEFICVVDSGCNISMLSQTTVEEGTEKAEFTGEMSTVEGIFGTVYAHLANVDFSLLSIGKQEGETELKPYTDTFQILTQRKYLASYNDENIPPIHGLISTDFMLKNKWVLDFGKEVIYSECA